MSSHFQNLELNSQVTSNNENYGNFYGVFTENEKELICDLANISEFNYYIKQETGNDIAYLLDCPLGNIEFRLRKINSNKLVGWAFNHGVNEKKVSLALIINGNIIAKTVADQYRKDLVDLGMSNGEIGYKFNYIKLFLKKN